MRTRNINKLIDAVVAAPITVTKRLDIWVASSENVQASGDLAEILGNIEECFSSFEKIKKYLSVEQQNALTEKILETAKVELPAAPASASTDNNNANG